MIIVVSDEILNNIKADGYLSIKLSNGKYLYSASSDYIEQLTGQVVDSEVQKNESSN